MLLDSQNHAEPLTGHALRNAHLRQRALARAETVGPLARLVVKIRAETLGLTRLELARRSGISRGTLRDLELGVHKPTRRIMRQFVAFCEQAGASSSQLEELHGLYAGPGETLEQMVARLELRAGSPRELAPWRDVERAARALSRGDEELKILKQLWSRDEQERRLGDRFGPALKQLRKKRFISRRQIADLFGIGGKKPARIIKYIEEDGFYSAKAYPAGLVAVLTDDAEEQSRLLQRWQKRRRQFHRRHRPETRTDLRLARELYGFAPQEMQSVLGYSNAEYQKIERGVTPLLETAVIRILHAINQAGQRRVAALLQQRDKRAAE